MEIFSCLICWEHHKICTTSVLLTLCVCIPYRKKPPILKYSQVVEILVLFKLPVTIKATCDHNGCLKLLRFRALFHPSLSLCTWQQGDLCYSVACTGFESPRPGRLGHEVSLSTSLGDLALQNRRGNLRNNVVFSIRDLLWFNLNINIFRVSGPIWTCLPGKESFCMRQNKKNPLCFLSAHQQVEMRNSNIPFRKRKSIWVVSISNKNKIMQILLGRSMFVLSLVNLPFYHYKT